MACTRWNDIVGSSIHCEQASVGHPCHSGAAGEGRSTVELDEQVFGFQEKSCETNCVLRFLRTPLHECVIVENKEAAEKLVSAGADVNLKVTFYNFCLSTFQLILPL